MGVSVADSEAAVRHAVATAEWCLNQARQRADVVRAREAVALTRETILPTLAKLAEEIIPPFPEVGIVGAGLMGVSIAACHLRHGCKVILFDNAPVAREIARQRVKAELELQCDDPAHVTAWLDQLICVSDLRDLSGCRCVLETIPEHVPLKQALFRELEEVVAGDCVFLTNTSTISAGRLAQALRWPQRLCGLHFLHPVRARPVVEVIPHKATDPGLANAVMRQALAVGKIPLQVSDSPGFVVNRLLFSYLNEGLKLLEEGVDVPTVDESARNAGFVMGPLRIMDEIGIDTVWAAGRVLWEAFPDRIEASPILVTLLKHKRLGRKSGKGFYLHEETSSWADGGQNDPSLTSLFAPWVSPASSGAPTAIGDRLLAAMVLEALLLIEERVAFEWQVVDAAAVWGLGFPITSGGPLYLACFAEPDEVQGWLSLHLPIVRRKWQGRKLVERLSALREVIGVAAGCHAHQSDSQQH